MSLKVYTLDLGVYGFAVAIASSREEAFQYMLDEHQGVSMEHTPNRLVEHGITAGYVDGNLGDQ